MKQEIKIKLLAENPDLIKPVSFNKAVSMLKLSKRQLESFIRNGVIKARYLDYDNNSPIKRRYLISLAELLTFQIMLEDDNFPRNFEQKHQDILLNIRNIEVDDTIDDEIYNILKKRKEQ